MDDGLLPHRRRVGLHARRGDRRGRLYRRAARRGTPMRHFLQAQTEALAVPAHAAGVMPAAVEGPLVGPSCVPHTLFAGRARAEQRAVPMPTIAAPADRELPPAPWADEDPQQEQRSPTAPVMLDTRGGPCEIMRRAGPIPTWSGRSAGWGDRSSRPPIRLPSGELYAAAPGSARNRYARFPALATIAPPRFSTIVSTLLLICVDCGDRAHDLSGSSRCRFPRYLWSTCLDIPNMRAAWAMLP